MKSEKIARAINQLAMEIHENADMHGWWDSWAESNNALAAAKVVGAKIALIHSELSEALEAIRDSYFDESGIMSSPYDKHLPNHLSIAIELADVIIRTLDLVAALGLDIGESLLAKHEYNKTREHRHGGKAL